MSHVCNIIESATFLQDVDLQYCNLSPANLLKAVTSLAERRDHIKLINLSHNLLKFDSIVQERRVPSLNHVKSTEVVEKLKELFNSAK